MLWGLCVTGAALVGQKGQVYRIDDRSRYSFHALLLPIGFLFRIHWPVENTDLSGVTKQNYTLMNLQR